MIVRIYERGASPPPDLHFAVCYDGTNREEVLALLNQWGMAPGAGHWVELPPASPQILRVVNTTGNVPLAVHEFQLGDWAVPDSASVRCTDAEFVDTYYLADSALTP